MTRTQWFVTRKSLLFPQLSLDSLSRSLSAWPRSFSRPNPGSPPSSRPSPSPGSPPSSPAQAQAHCSHPQPQPKPRLTAITPGSASPCTLLPKHCPGPSEVVRGGGSPRIRSHRDKPLPLLLQVVTGPPTWSCSVPLRSLPSHPRHLLKHADQVFQTLQTAPRIQPRGLLPGMGQLQYWGRTVFKSGC